MREIGFFDNGVGPDPFQQFVFAQDVTALRYQRREQFEGFGWERDDFAAAQQDVFAWIQAEGTEFIKALFP